MKVTVSRKAHFNAAHRLYRKDWSFDKNDEVFGKCNNPNFHGHNYELIVSVTGDIDLETGYVIDMKGLKNIIKEEVKEDDYHRIETSFGKFERSFTLPKGSDAENITASNKDGVLEVVIPKLKSETEKAKKIEVK